MEKIIIEFNEKQSTEEFPSGWKVTKGDCYADGLCYEEMIGLVISLSMPDKRPCLHWMKTEEEHRKYKESNLK